MSKSKSKAEEWRLQMMESRLDRPKFYLGNLIVGPTEDSLLAIVEDNGVREINKLTGIIKQNIIEEFINFLVENYLPNTTLVKEVKDEDEG